VAAILVYAELNQGKVATTSLELMTRARELGDVYAVALGAGAKAAAATLGKHGAKAVHVNEDPAFDDYIAEPATEALSALYEKEKPDLILFAFTSDSREVAARLGAHLQCQRRRRQGWGLRRSRAVLRRRQGRVDEGERQTRDRPGATEVVRGFGKRWDRGDQATRSQSRGGVEARAHHRACRRSL